MPEFIAPAHMRKLVLFPLLLGSMLSAVCAAALAQQDSNSVDNQSIGLDELVVLGSLTQMRSIMDSPVPVDVFSREDLLATGAPGNQLGLALSILAPSFNFPQQSNSVTSDHIASPQLRGMSPDQILVLINGKRKHTSAVVNDNTKIGRGTSAVDLNTIPLSAVKRVEILRDGASAQYGTDAIAGVINIILDDRVGGTDIMASYGANHSDVAPIARSVTDGQTVSAYLEWDWQIRLRKCAASPMARPSAPTSITVLICSSGVFCALVPSFTIVKAPIVPDWTMCRRFSSSHKRRTTWPWPASARIVSVIRKPTMSSCG